MKNCISKAKPCTHNIQEHALVQWSQAWLIALSVHDLRLLVNILPTLLTLQLILMPWLCGNLKATDTFCKINKKMSKVNIYNDLQGRWRYASPLYWSLSHCSFKSKNTKEEWTVMYILAFPSKCQSLSRIWLFATPQTVCSPPGFSVHGILQARILSGLPFPSPRDLPDPGIKPMSSVLQADSSPSEPPEKPGKGLGKVHSHLRFPIPKATLSGQGRCHG